MELTTLKMFRVFVPGAIFLLGAFALGMITGLFKMTQPDLDTIMKSVSVLIVGILYMMTPLRSWINKSYSDRVNENIRSAMVRIAKLPDDKAKYQWKNIRKIFYDIVDNDESLKVKGKIVMFNGLIWTSAADLTAISILYLGYSLILVLSDVNNAAYAAIAYFVTGLLGFVGSVKTTERHIELGNDQLDLIQEKHAAAVNARVSAIA